MAQDDPSQGFVIRASSISVDIKDWAPTMMLTWARRYCDAASQLPHLEEGYTPVPTYLTSLAIELALKAYLLARGWGRADLRSLGHDLSRTLDAARDHGLGDLASITPEQEAEIRRVSGPYRANKLRYLEPDPDVIDEILTGYKNRADCVVLLSACESLLGAVRSECARAAYRGSTRG